LSGVETGGKKVNDLDFIVAGSEREERR